MALIEQKDLSLQYDERAQRWQCFFRGEECNFGFSGDTVTYRSLDLEIDIGTTDIAGLLQLVKKSEAPDVIKKRTVITIIARAQGKRPEEMLNTKLKRMS